MKVTTDARFPELIVVLESAAAGEVCRAAWYNPRAQDYFLVTVHRDVVIGEVFELRDPLTPLEASE